MIYKTISIILLLNFLIHYKIYSQSISFEDKTKEMNINFKHFNGESGKKYYTESVGAGCCIIDYNNDNYMDIFFVQGNEHQSELNSINRSNILYKNNKTEFLDVTKEVGLINSDYGIGRNINVYLDLPKIYKWYCMNKLIYHKKYQLFVIV